MKFGIGQSVRREEDPRLLKGLGAYLDDQPAAGALRAIFVRSPIPHARILDVDATAARAAPGVLAVLLGDELEAEGVNDIDAVTVPNRDGARAPRPQRPLIAADRVRFAGEPVAMVLARTRAEAVDAAELVEVDYEELPAVVDTAQAEHAEGSALHAGAPGNLAFDWAYGNETEVDARIAQAAHRVEIELVNNRIVGSPMEPRGAIGHWDANEQKLHLAISGQNVWRTRDEVSVRLGLKPEHVRVTIGDVGGGFGTKAMTYPEYTAVAYACRKTGFPVRWIADRSEAFLSDAMGRDHVTCAVGAFDNEFRLQALRVDSTVAMGAYLSPHGAIIPSVLLVKVLPGAYDFQHLFYSVHGVYTNTAPVDAYRGAGRPEANYVIERLMDIASREFGLCPMELRRRNFVSPDSFPYRSAAGEIYDVGEFKRVLTRAGQEADIEGFAERRKVSAGRGKLRGLGVAYYVECILGDRDEHAELRLMEDGCWELLVGTQSNGQGHATSYKQILHDAIGISPKKVRVVEGDSERIPAGGGTGGSRSVTAQGFALIRASDALVELLRKEAEEALEADSADIEFEPGLFRVVGSDRTVSVDSIAERAIQQGRAPSLSARVLATLPERAFPNGCHICEVEIDPETGEVRVVRYAAVDDFGLLINPLLVEGQVHGGVVQGIGQAILEHAFYDNDGQLITGSFMDYALPRADSMPNMVFRSEPIPSTTNPLGMKGCGEAGTVGALPAVANSVLDALWELGIRHVDMPMTPARIWQLISSA